MSTTKNLGLNKHDNVTTNENKFDIEKYLSINWDKIDDTFGNQDKAIKALETDNTTNKTKIENIEQKDTEKDTEIEDIKEKDTEQDTKLEELKEELKNNIPTRKRKWRNNKHI